MRKIATVVAILTTALLPLATNAQVLSDTLDNGTTNTGVLFGQTGSNQDFSSWEWTPQISGCVGLITLAYRDNSTPDETGDFGLAITLGDQFYVSTLTNYAAFGWPTDFSTTTHPNNRFEFAPCVTVIAGVTYTIFPVGTAAPASSQLALPTRANADNEPEFSNFVQFVNGNTSEFTPQWAPLWRVGSLGFSDPNDPLQFATSTLQDSTTAICGNLSTTSTNFLTQLASDFSVGFCSAMAFVFVPSKQSIENFQNLPNIASSRTPFSYAVSIRNTWGQLSASTTGDFASVEIPLGNIGYGSTTAMGNILPNISMTSSTLATYLTPGILTALRTLAGITILLGLMLNIYIGIKHLPKTK